MRFINKYKRYSKPLSLIKNYPELRILKFKRPKWQRIQTFLKNKNLRFDLKPFFDNLRQKSSYKKWDKIRSQYKEGLTLKQSILTLYDHCFSLPYFKKALLGTKSKKKLLLFALIKPLFRLDILLWRLNIFNSPYSARHYIQNGLVQINSKKITQVSFITRGDIITLTHKINASFLSCENFDFLASFVEYDKYSNTIIIIKDFVDITNEDLYLLIKDSVILGKFINYIETK